MDSIYSSILSIHIGQMHSFVKNALFNEKRERDASPSWEYAFECWQSVVKHEQRRRHRLVHGSALADLLK